MESKLQFDFSTYQDILLKIAEIDTFKGRWKIEKATEKSFLSKLKKQTMVKSIGSSTRIVVSTLTNDEVETLLKNMKITQLKTRDEQEVAGYYEVLTLVTESFSEIPITENYIAQLHALLLKHSDKDQRHRGAYKTLSNQVVATSPEGTQRIVFNTTPPHLTTAAMQDLVQWTNQTFETRKMHPLLIVAVFTYEFLSIHPFQDGNGRLSRLMTTWLLLKQGYDFVLFTSFENLIEERKREYYKVLMDGQQKRGRTEEPEIIDKWVLFFLDCLLTLTQRLTEKRHSYIAVKDYLNERQKQVLSFLTKNSPSQVSDISQHLPQIPRATLKRDLSILVERKLLTQVGKGRGVRYFALSDIHEERHIL